MKSGIAIVTPLKNEIDNIDTLFESVASQQCDIDVWIIVENGSTDGSAEKLRSISVPANVKRLEVITFSLPVETYALGVKYATVVNQGFLKLHEMVSEYGMVLPSYVGILDADCAPSVGYFSELSKRMEADSVDLASGVGVFDNGRPDGEAKDWVRGNCRLWSWRCFADVGYVVGPSADTLSLSKAVSRGYRTKPYHDLIYRCREMGKKSRYDYYGYSAYYRGVTIGYASIRTFLLLFRGNAKNAFEYYRGYLRSFIAKDPRTDDAEIFEYFQSALGRKVKALIKL